MIDVPQIFRPHHPFQYPVDNVLIFEEWYYKHFKEYKSEREYLPVFWTSYYCKHKYGKDTYAMRELQSYIDSLDRSKKYYTIIQYDDGILTDLKDLDCFVFGMSGKGADYNLPLICTPHRFTFPGIQKDLFLNFIGRITHPIRQQMIDSLPKRPDYYISTKPHKLQEYCRILARSVFTLCPRGYGATSFRIQEALQYGSIPIYISDKFVRAHDKDFAYECSIDKLRLVLNTHLDKELIESLQKSMLLNYKDYFTYEANKKIIETINSSPIQKQARAS